LLRSLIALALGLILVLGIPVNHQPVYAYQKDFHYYWTFFLALVCSFSWDEAHLIASGNQRMDDTDMEAELNDPDNKNWHAFGTPEEVKKREDELWKRTTAETDGKKQFVKFGQLLHFVQDENPHSGYPVGTGHAEDGHAPDSPGNDAKKTESSTRDTLEYIKRMMQHLGRAPSDLCDYDKIKHVLNQMINNSKPGFLWNSGQSRNREAIEIAMYNLVSAKIPDSIKYVNKPGEPKKTRPVGELVPEPIEIEYDDKGEPKQETFTVALNFRPEIKVAVKNKEKATLVSVKNNGEEPIHVVEVNNPDGNIKFVKARGWDRDKIDESTAVVFTDERPVMPGGNQVLLVLGDKPVERLNWAAGDSRGNLLAGGTVPEQVKPEPLSEKIVIEESFRMYIVDNETNQPVVGASVIIRNEEGRIVATITSGTGGYARAELEPGEYKVTVQAEGYYYDFVNVEKWMWMNGQLSMTNGLDPLSDEEKTGESTIKFKITSKDSKPLSGAEITIMDMEGKVIFVGKSDENGIVELQTKVPKGTPVSLKYKISAEGYKETSGTINMRTGDSLTLGLELGEESTEKIKVIIYNGKYIPIDQVHLGTGEECKEGEVKVLHWHANGNTVTATDGTVMTDPNPSGCAGNDALDTVFMVIVDPDGAQHGATHGNVGSSDNVIPPNKCHTWFTKPIGSFIDLPPFRVGTYTGIFCGNIIGTGDSRCVSSDFDITMFVLPESPLGSVILVISSLATLVAFITVKRNWSKYV
jgi:hypothetical protein